MRMYGKQELKRLDELDTEFFVKPESENPKSKVPKSRLKGLGLRLKSHGPPTIRAVVVSLYLNYV